MTFDTPYQPGGTATIVGGNWTGRATTESDTELGRWSEIKIIGKERKAVRIFTAYGVIDNSTAGEKTAYRQQSNILKKQGRDETDPRGTMFRDLGKRIQEVVRQGEEVILMIDANDSLAKPKGRFSMWVGENKLVDIMIQRHGTEEEPATFAGGSTRIDYILMTARIAEYTNELNICLTQSPAVTGTVTHDDALGERHFSDRIIGGRRCNRSLPEQLARRYCPYTRVYSSRH
jgi:hypothetical protein